MLHRLTGAMHIDNDHNDQIQALDGTLLKSSMFAQSLNLHHSPPPKANVAPLDQRQQLLFLAQTAETAERFVDMVTFMSELISKHCGPGFELSKQERDAFAAGFKNVTAQKRDALRSLRFIREDPREQQLLHEYKQQVQVELSNMCKQAIELTHVVLQTHPTEDEAYIFYYKMLGDYYRYLAELLVGQGFERSSLDHYQRASKTSEALLTPAHPLRLGVALNMSVLLFEVLDDRKNAYATAKAAFDGAIPLLDRLDSKSYRDSTLLMQLLRDNITLWLADQQNP